MFNWDHIGKPLSTADASASVPTVTQRFKVNSGYRNQILRTVVTSLIFYNTPSFSTVKLEIWSDDNGSPGRLMATSDSFTQAECNTALACLRKMGFTFSGLALRKNTYYHLAVRPTGYTGDATAHIAWRQDFPDPKYPTNITLTLEFGDKYPYDAIFETADL